MFRWRAPWGSGFLYAAPVSQVQVQCQVEGRIRRDSPAAHGAWRLRVALRAVCGYRMWSASNVGKGGGGGGYFCRGGESVRLD